LEGAAALVMAVLRLFLSGAWERFVVEKYIDERRTLRE
jgi:hypothetical protein